MATHPTFDHRLDLAQRKKDGCVLFWPVNSLAGRLDIMSLHTSHGLNDRHLLQFGRITQKFAAYEMLIHRIMARLLKTQVASVMLLSRPLSFLERREALLNLLCHHEVPADQCDRVRDYLNVPLTHERLHQAIIHAPWSVAQNLNTIQPNWILNPLPRIKPVLAEADRLPVDFRESEDDRVAYSLDDFVEIVATLEGNLADFSAYLRDVGLVDDF